MDFDCHEELIRDTWKACLDAFRQGRFETAFSKAFVCSQNYVTEDLMIFQFVSAKRAQLHEIAKQMAELFIGNAPIDSFQQSLWRLALDGTHLKVAQDRARTPRERQKVEYLSLVGIQDFYVQGERLVRLCSEFGKDDASIIAEMASADCARHARSRIPENPEKVCDVPWPKHSSGTVEAPPHVFSEERIFQLVSADGQIYWKCMGCDMEKRCKPTDVMFGNDLKCRRCVGKDGHFVRHDRITRVICRACNVSSTQRLIAHQSPCCGACRSTAVDVQSSEIVPHFPSEFESLDSDHRWGVDANCDVFMVRKELILSQNTLDFDSLLLYYTSFLDRLILHCDYGDPDTTVMLYHEKGDLYRTCYRRTGHSLSGARAVKCCDAALAIADGRLTKAICLVNLAKNIYSILAKRDVAALAQCRVDASSAKFKAMGKLMMATDTVVEEVDRFVFREFKNEAISAALHSIELLTRVIWQGARETIARQYFLLGDICKSCSPTTGELDTAIEYYDEALKSRCLNTDTESFVRSSRAEAILQRSGYASQEGRSALETLQSLSKQETESTIWQESWKNSEIYAEQLFRIGKHVEAIPHLEKVVEGITGTLLRTKSPMNFSTGETFANLFAMLGEAYRTSGRPMDGMSITDYPRGQTLLGSMMEYMPFPDHQHAVIFASMAEIFSGMRGKLTMDQLRDQHLDPLSLISAYLAYLSRAFQHVDTLLVYYSFFRGQSAVYLYNLSEREMVLHKNIGKFPNSHIHAIKSLKIANEVGGLRERRIQRLCDYSRQLLIDPVIDKLQSNGLRSVVFCTPAVFSIIPFEACLASVGRELPVAVSNIPSIRIGASMHVGQVSANSSTRKRVLIVGYFDKGLPGVNSEIDTIASFYTGQVTILRGMEGDKARLLSVLTEEYDIIHFACHGTEDLADPMNSALHLSENGAEDRYRITARDLLTIKKLGTRCTVVLSACSSAAVSNDLFNSYLGLVGSFIRLGATSIIASRWPVRDDIADIFMRSFHSSFSKGVEARIAVAHAQVQARTVSEEIGDWAAFTHIGI